MQVHERLDVDHDCGMEHMRCDQCGELIEECGRSGLCDDCLDDDGDEDD